MSLPVIVVKGTFSEGRPADGSVNFQLTDRVKNAAGKTLIPAFSRAAQINPDDGTFSITLPASDDPGASPSPMPYTVTWRISGANPEQYDVLIPHDAAGGVIDLYDLTPVGETPPDTPGVVWATAADVADEAATRAAADEDLQTAIAEAGAVQTVAGVEPVDQDVPESGLATALGIPALSSGLTAETTARGNADTALGAAITTEADRAQSAEAALATAVAAKAATTALTAETSRAAAAEDVNAAAIAAETTRAEGIEAAKADLVAGKIPVSQVPASAFTMITHVADVTSMLALDVGGEGALVRVADDGDGEQALFLLPAGSDPSDEADWLEVNYDPDGAAAAAEAAAESFATAAVAGEATIARAAESANATAITAEASRAETAEALKADAADLAAVAISGAYSDLTGTPTLGSIASHPTSDFLTPAQGNAAYEPIVEPITTIAASGTAQTLGYGNTLETLTGNCTNTLPAPVAGQEVVVRAVQDGTGGRTLTWATASGSIVWDGGAAPSYLTAAGNVSVTVFTCWTAGTWDAVVSAYDLR